MPSEYGRTAAVAFATDTCSCDVPSNTAAHQLIAIVSTNFATVSPAAVHTLSGWTSIVTSDLSTTIFGPTEVHTEVFYHAGGVAGPITVTCNKTANIFSVKVL